MSGTAALLQDLLAMERIQASWYDPMLDALRWCADNEAAVLFHRTGVEVEAGKDRAFGASFVDAVRTLRAERGA